MSKNRRQPSRTSQRRPTTPGSAQRAPRAGGSRRPAPAPVTRPGWRGNVERVSYPILLRLTRAPKWLLGAVTGAVLLGGLLAPSPWSPLLLSLVILFLTWLLVLAWPKLQPPAKILRGAVIGALAALVIARLFGAM